ncbi:MULTISPECIES: sugar 3,4-ketoisomerase [Spirosoma]|uniref:FdtA/QdtA family cupin domain-containing protein n=1 Tax=Spirosoma liriopis TaxID=2937440 RepID=A0ABT0HF56_9BACT|nr:MULTISPECIES: FdtA/QdtA family cupin domain-containing protein [Spirosoma]MCK8490791.1 FdtA/QdtA family cupin domain-containing protein [Spirosoma liriopis]UHG90177.1 FdtA/QdtA family cupin domain-containing protein [Spirosoma oryzicola]
MAKLYELKTFISDTGNLTVFENVIPGTIQRVFYIYGAGQNPRAGHRHHRTWNALVCLNGSCQVYNHNGYVENTYFLDNPTKCLVLEPEDWHIMDNFSSDAILLVISNALYDKDDYIYEPYPNSRRLNEPELVNAR